MDETKELSHAQCILLAVTFAADSNIKALHAFTPARSDVFEPELVLRILLTYLPESVNSSTYATYIGEVATRVYLEQQEDVAINCSSVLNLSERDARSQLRKLHLLPLAHPSVPDKVRKDLLTTFLIHRAHRIDAATGLLPLTYQLLSRFLDRSDYLKGWFASTILPLHRLGYEYYPQDEHIMGLDGFEGLQGSKGVHILLAKAKQSSLDGTATSETVGRDLRGIVGPWIYGSNQRKRRKLHHNFRRQPSTNDTSQELHFGTQTVSADQADQFGDWRHLFKWIVSVAVDNFSLAVNVIEGWDGPNDVNLGGCVLSHQLFEKDDEVDLDLKRQYCQAAFASVYVAEQDGSVTVGGGHAILVRLAALLEFEPPPNLATSVDLLPKIERHVEPLENASRSLLQPESLLKPGHPLTTPKLESYSLLQMLVYSAYLLNSVGHGLSLRNVAKLRFWSDEMEQMKLVQTILHGLSSGSKREDQWAYIRNTLLWLRSWGLTDEDQDAPAGYGVFGKVNKESLEKEILKALCGASLFSLITRIYVDPSSEDRSLSTDEVEKVILDLAMHYYDNASNGNRTRGGVKKASEILAALRPYFPQSSSFRQYDALLAATHAMSYYSLTLQHGVPFQPVNIRVSDDPISLIAKILDQNPRSYSKLDDLIEIGRNLAIATTTNPATSQIFQQPQGNEDFRLCTAERRVIGMAIAAALDEDDFETAYSYVVNRLVAPSNQPDNTSLTAEDDISWRAAFQAGRHRSSSARQSGSKHVRRLEQRMELLSQSLLLAPPAALPEILAVWRRCEEELVNLLAQQTADELDFDDKAGAGDVRVPGVFVGEEPKFMVQSLRKEIGRGATEEAPMGLFEVARGAAAAFGRSAGSLRRVENYESPTATTNPPRTSVDDGEGRVRKRDMVANVVTGGLASGLGWVLGATAVNEQIR